MLDEEVNVTLKRKRPKNKTLESLAMFLDTSCIVGGAIGGYALLNDGAEFGKFWSLILGAPFGAVFGGFSYHLLETSVKTYLNSKFKQSQEQEDTLAKQNGSTSAKFRYRGNSIECVIRPEFEGSGKIFYISTNDPDMPSAAFSYQPNRDVPLKFRFTIPAFKKEKELAPFQKAHTNIENYLDQVTGELLGQYGAEEENRKPKIILNEKSYIKTMNSKVDQIEGPFKVRYEGCNKFLHTIISYNGENYNSDLFKFTNLISELMDYARVFRLNAE